MKANSCSSKVGHLAMFLGVLFAASLALFLGIFTTASRLISLGIMRQSLCSDIESVKSIAHATVSSFRVLCVFGAVAIICGGLMWQRIVRLPIVKRINAHEVRYSSIRSRILAPFNASCVVIGVCLFFAAVFIRWGPVWFDPDFLASLGGEDRFIERLQAPLFLLCCASFLLLSIRFRGPRSYRVMYGIFAFAFFLMAGEEISWGQRIFNIETPEALKKINVQGEINLHNLFGYGADHLFMAAVLVYGFIFPVAAHWSAFVRKQFDLIGLPLPTLGLAMGFLLVSLTHYETVSWLIIQPYPFLNADYINELRELLTAIAFGLLSFESLWLFKLTHFKESQVGFTGANHAAAK